MAALTGIALSAGFMASLGLLLALILVVANKRLFVYEDPRIDEVEELLPRANCGACGSPGCRPFAEGLVAGEFDPSRCTVNPEETNALIADYLGVELGQQVKQVARLACAGGSHVAYNRARYEGLDHCRAAALVSGGGKDCVWGCLGMGDCGDVCDFDAIQMNRHGLPLVNEAICTACGDCVDVCPKNLFSLQPITHQLFIACKNLEKGDHAEAVCEVLCTACERCVVDSPEGLITVRNNLAVIDYDKNTLASKVAIERCPTGAIIWFDQQGGFQVGRDAKKIIRKTALPVARRT